MRLAVIEAVCYHALDGTVGSYFDSCLQALLQLRRIMHLTLPCFMLVAWISVYDFKLIVHYVLKCFLFNR